MRGGIAKILREQPAPVNLFRPHFRAVRRAVGGLARCEKHGFLLAGGGAFAAGRMAVNVSAMGLAFAQESLAVSSVHGSNE
jgi:hypothetical protein